MLGRQMSTQRRPTGGSSRMNESSDTPDNPDKPQDYPGLRAKLAELVNDFLPVADELWPRLQDHKYRWELYGYRLPEDTTNLSPRTSSPCWSKRSRASVSPVTNSHMLTSKPTTTTPTAQKRHDQEFFPAGQHPAEFRSMGSRRRARAPRRAAPLSGPAARPSLGAGRPGTTRWVAPNQIPGQGFSRPTPTDRHS